MGWMTLKDFTEKDSLMKIGCENDASLVSFLVQNSHKNHAKIFHAKIICMTFLNK